ncbi:radical SAM protein [Methylosinus sp. Sm6]|uniref:radical SAM protein n=1 Tax=Methylosinus sp. Sm6 TaxID=2866948 RepID=UPI001C99A1E5|nr:radical SAM protein [Methylosinus sp. Sm6]MBY6243147.1 radical SAM protein [Methylosinus sp. Sm6]
MCSDNFVEDLDNFVEDLPPAAEGAGQSRGSVQHAHPRSLTIMPTSACTARCNDCGTFVGRCKISNLPLSVMLNAIDQAKVLNFQIVVFTGGEATLLWDNLLRAISHAASLGMPTRLVTNGHWAVEATTGRMLDQLVGAGLTEINFSTGDEHAKYVPIERVVAGIIASRARNLTVHIMVETRAEKLISKETLLQHPEIIRADCIRADNITENPWMSLDPYESEGMDPARALNASNVGASMGCESVLSHYTLYPDGIIAGCCGLGQRAIAELNVGMARGDDFLREATAVAEDDYVKIWMKFMGPVKLLQWAATKDETIAWENAYAHKCQACLRAYLDPKVRKVVAEHFQELVPDLLLARFLDDELLPSISSPLLESLEPIENDDMIDAAPALVGDNSMENFSRRRRENRS